jgi:predicted metalloprotease with PDZ domain
VAMTQSFAVGYGPTTTAEGLKRIFGHEMTHTWTAKEEVGKWFNEGNAVYYQGLLPWRAGLITTDQYLADINQTASRYYTNAMRHTPEDQVLAAFWDDTRIRVLPYDRGAMYFAVLNGKIRKASGGKRSLDDLIRTMVVRIKTDQPVSEAIWLDMLRREIGEDGPATHRAMMAGELMLPESDGFGPCFRRTPAKIRQFDMGFDNKSLLGADKTIQGLKPDSEAAKAGVRDGDKVISGGASDSIQADVTRTVTLKLMRDGKPLSVTYLPRGQTVDAYQWERDAGDPETASR